MKKYIIILIILFNMTTIHATSRIPHYKITASSNQQDDLDEMYRIKDALLKDYKKWVKGVSDVDSVLADHTYVYQATYYNGEYVIVLGEGKGKSIDGQLRVSYCASSQDIKKKSFFESIFS